MQATYTCHCQGYPISIHQSILLLESCFFFNLLIINYLSNHLLWSGPNLIAHHPGPTPIAIEKQQLSWVGFHFLLTICDNYEYIVHIIMQSNNIFLHHRIWHFQWWNNSCPWPISSLTIIYQNSINATTTILATLDFIIIVTKITIVFGLSWMANKYGNLCTILAGQLIY